MSIDLIAQMNFEDPDAWKEFHLAHGFDHAVYADLVQGKYNVQVPSMDISWVNQKDRMEMTNWLQVHDQIHQSISLATGLGVSPDLQTVDLNDKDQFYDWMYYHQLIHDQIDQILGAQ